LNSTDVRARLTDYNKTFEIF